jgi:hypothetical protein
MNYSKYGGINEMTIEVYKKRHLARYILTHAVIAGGMVLIGIALNAGWDMVMDILRSAR